MQDQEWIYTIVTSRVLGLKGWSLRLQFTVIVLVITLIGIPPNLQNASGIDSSEELVWQLVFISSHPACSNSAYQMTNQYHNTAIGYFELYQLENYYYDPLCIPEKKYSILYEIPEDLDLLILVYDRDLGRAELFANGIGGLYHHEGQDLTKNHVIILCDCPNFEYSDPTWILTHEMSHFILFYKGFNKSIVEDLIHERDSQYDICIESGLASLNENCASVKIKMMVGSYQRNVMELFAPAVGQNPISDFFQTIESLSDDNNDLRKIITDWWLAGKINNEDLRKIITNWWLAGKINNENFQKFMELLIEGQHMLEEKTLTSQPFFGTKTFTDAPEDQKKDWKNYNEKLGLTDEKLENILKRVPFIKSQTNFYGEIDFF